MPVPAFARQSPVTKRAKGVGSLSESRIKRITRITRIKGESRATGNAQNRQRRSPQGKNEKAKGGSRIKWIKQMKGGLKTRVG